MLQSYTAIRFRQSFPPPFGGLCGAEEGEDRILLPIRGFEIIATDNLPKPRKL
jgi:hypothetical protein